MRRTISTSALCCIALIISLQSGSATAIYVPNDLQQGPYVDKVVYRVIASDDYRIQALLSGEIDLDTSFDGYHNLISLLTEDPDIEVFESPRNGYGSIIINCARYPFNISGFRRAFAFAFNKTKVMYEILGGHASLHDSVVPSVSRWCAEDLFDYHYYDAEPGVGNAILDELGFTIDGETGFRNAPNGDPISITVLYFQQYEEVVEVVLEALHSLNFNAACQPFGDFSPPPGFDVIENDDYDMCLLGSNFQLDNIDWLVAGYGSDYIDTSWGYYYNPSNFVNETYDSWIDQLRNGKTFEEISEAVTEMQKILHYNVPQLVVYQNSVMQGYRTDQFKGHVEDLFRYISGLWTLRNIRPVNNSFGGTVVVSIDQEPDSFNIFTTNSPYSNMILENLYSSLYSRDPNMNPIPDLVESMIIETHNNNSEVAENHTRFTFDIIQNATWSDGEPLTAEDIAFTFNYIYMSRAYGNPAGDDMDAFVTAYAPDPYRVIIEFSTESYWHFNNIAYDWIIPEHIFSTIGYSNWNTWNPVFDIAQPHVVCGPFTLTDYDAGEYYELTQNPNYYWHPDIPPTPSPTTLTPTTTISKFPIELLLFLVMMASTATIVIVLGLVIDKYRRK